MESILVSIIVPVYNTEKYLYRCIDSILEQTYCNIEIILIDDGSTDNSSSICDSYSSKDKRILVKHQKNTGQGIARNVGLQEMKGDYVLFVDSDDEMRPDMLEKLVAATNNGKNDIVLCGITINNGIRLVDSIWYNVDYSCTNEKLIFEYISSGKIFTGPICKLFKKTIFENIRFPSFRANEDAYIMHHLLGKCKNAFFIKEHLYIMNLHSDSTEGKAFNPNKTHLIDCAYDLRSYIQNEYPQFLRFVDKKVIEDAMILVKKLYSQRLEKKYEETEKLLQSTISIEREYIKEKYSDSSILKEVEMYLNSPGRFKRWQRIMGVKNSAKRKIKGGLTCIKNIIKR